MLIFKFFNFVFFNLAFLLFWFMCHWWVLCSQNSLLAYQIISTVQEFFYSCVCYCHWLSVIINLFLQMQFLIMSDIHYIQWNFDEDTNTNNSLMSKLLSPITNNWVHLSVKKLFVNFFFFFSKFFSGYCLDHEE